MKTFDEIVGNEDIKKYFNKAIKHEHLSHSYIFEGPYGTGKKTMAIAIAKVLLCEGEEHNKPCNQCKACHMVDALTHPDLILVEKDTRVTKIDTIREKVIKTMEIKPYQGEYKIVIITEADTVNIEGQNAMLKTIEEPPSYGIIFLLSENISKLLPTIKSRCISMRFTPLDIEKLKDYFKENHVDKDKIKIYARFCEGSIGLANKLMKDEEFIQTREKSITYLERLEEADLIKLYGLVKEICDEKEKIVDILNFWHLWYRDIGILKTMYTDNLYYGDYKQQLLDIAYKLPYNKINMNIEHIKEAKQAINQNIYATFVIENLLFKIKERKK